MEFCDKLLLLRRRCGMTQTELAQALGVTRQSVYKWETGQSYPEAMTLFAMRGLFRVSVDALLDPAVTLDPTETDTAEPRLSAEEAVHGEEPENRVPPGVSDFASARTPGAPGAAAPDTAPDTATGAATGTGVVTDTPSSAAPAAEREDGKKKKKGFFARLFR